MKIIMTLFALLFSVLMMAQDGKLPIIDMHMHSYPIGYMGGSNIPNPVTGKPSGATSVDLHLCVSFHFLGFFGKNIGVLDLYSR
jgi:hypothetical protein